MGSPSFTVSPVSRSTSCIFSWSRKDRERSYQEVLPTLAVRFLPPVPILLRRLRLPWEKGEKSRGGARCDYVDGRFWLVYFPVSVARD